MKIINFSFTVLFVTCLFGFGKITFGEDLSDNDSVYIDSTIECQVQYRDVDEEVLKLVKEAFERYDSATTPTIKSYSHVDVDDRRVIKDLSNNDFLTCIILPTLGIISCIVIINLLNK